MKRLIPTSRAAVLAVLGLSLVWVSACKKEAPEKDRPYGMSAGADEVVAKVGDYEITGLELARTAHSYAQKLMMQGRRPPPGYEDSILDVMIKSEVLYQSGKDLELPDLSEKVESMYQGMVKQFPNEQAFADALAQEGLSPQELRERIKKDVVVNAVLEKKIYAELAVTDEEVAAFYRDNPAAFSRPETIRARHILVMLDPAATEEQKQAAREKMDKIKERLEKEDFAAVASEVSEDPGSKTQGGDLGFFPQGQMDPVFEKAAWSLSTGQLSDLVETRFGYHLIKLEERRPAGTVPFEEVKANIAEMLKGRKSAEKIDEYCRAASQNLAVQKLRAPAPAGLPGAVAPEGAGAAASEGVGAAAPEGVGAVAPETSGAAAPAVSPSGETGAEAPAAGFSPPPPPPPGATD